MQSNFFPIQTRYNISNVTLFIQCFNECLRVRKSTRIINTISLDKTHYTRVTDSFQFWFGTPPSLSHFESATCSVVPSVIVELNASSFYTSFRTKLQLVRNGSDRLRTTFFPAGIVTFTPMTTALRTSNCWTFSPNALNSPGGGTGIVCTMTM